MILKVFWRLAAIFALAAPVALSAATPDESLLGAYDAYRAGDALKFARHARNLEGHLLEPWLDYWRVSMRLEDMSNAEVRAVLDKNKDLYVAERLRSDWLRVLGKRGDWA